jgi:hypothetical protein
MSRKGFSSIAAAIVAFLSLVGCSEVNDVAQTASAPASFSLSGGVAKRESLADERLVARFTTARDNGNVSSSPLLGPEHKIIYQAHIELAVERFAGIGDEVAKLAKQSGAYVADSSLSGSTGESRHGIWKIRVPVAHFEDFVTAAKGLGELVRASTTSQDVSEEYYDVDAIIRNKTKHEERLIALLEERPGKLEDVIAIERELSRVREELERMQGRMRFLTDRTSLTTVELSIAEIRNYEPAQAATLATRLRRSLEKSATTLQTSGEALLVAAVGIVPWLPVAALGAAAVYPLVRWPLRRRNRIGAVSS